MQCFHARLASCFPRTFAPCPWSAQKFGQKASARRRAQTAEPRVAAMAAEIEDTLTFSKEEAAAFIDKPDRHVKLEALWAGAEDRHGGKEFPEEWKEGGKNWGLVDSAKECDRGAAQFIGLLNASAKPVPKPEVAVAKAQKRPKNVAVDPVEQEIWEVRK